ncbi:MAG: hypothetical protein HIU86_07230 [Acidobacteria bacterium]|nr:hypothetical protein [Acidobacteriota bacterium]
MTIPYFGTNQNVVFIPALLALLASTVVICLPIVFAPSLRRSRRRVPLLAVAGVLALIGLAGTVVLAATGFRTLGDERARVQASIQRIYGLQLTGGEVGDLVDNGKPPKSLPAVAEALRLQHPGAPKTLELKPTAAGGDTYALFFAGKPFPAAS